MLGLSILFFVLTLLSAVLGFGGVIPDMSMFGRLSFAVCLGLFALFMRREFRRQRAYTQATLEPVTPSNK